MKVTVELDDNTYGSLGIMALQAGDETIEDLLRALTTLQVASWQKAMETHTVEELKGLAAEIIGGSSDLQESVEVARRRAEAPASSQEDVSAPDFYALPTGGPPTFRCEDSLWKMLADGTKTFDTRKYDLADDRIRRLARGSAPGFPNGPVELTPEMQKEPEEGEEISFLWVPDEPLVSFINKATGQLLTFEYLGMEFHHQMPGWCILVLGSLVYTEAITVQPFVIQLCPSCGKACDGQACTCGADCDLHGEGK